MKQPINIVPILLLLTGLAWGSIVAAFLVLNLGDKTMAGCNVPMTVFVPRGWDYKEITVHCGNTSPEGTPYLCDRCEKANAGRDWRREAIEAGEQWEEDY